MEAYQHQAEETIRAVIQGVHEGTARGEFVIHERLFSNSAHRHPERMTDLCNKWIHLMREVGKYRQFQPTNNLLVELAMRNLERVSEQCLGGYFDLLAKSVGPEAEWCLQVSFKAFTIPDQREIKTEIILQVYIPKTNNGAQNPINLYTQATSLDLTAKPKKQPGDIRQRTQRNITGRLAHA